MKRSQIGLFSTSVAQGYYSILSARTRWHGHVWRPGDCGDGAGRAGTSGTLFRRRGTRPGNKTRKDDHDLEEEVMSVLPLLFHLFFPLRPLPPFTFSSSSSFSICVIVINFFFFFFLSSIYSFCHFLSSCFFFVLFFLILIFFFLGRSNHDRHPHLQERHCGTRLILPGGGDPSWGCNPGPPALTPRASLMFFTDTLTCRHGQKFCSHGEPGQS